MEQHQRTESAAAAKPAKDGHLARLWRRPLAGDRTTATGLYRAGSQAALDGLLAALPLADGLRATVTPLEAHPNDPGDGLSMSTPASRPFPDPGLPPRSHPGRTARPRRPRPGRRRIVPLTGGTFTGPDLTGKLLPGSSADWQTILPDGTALGDIRYTLQTDKGRSALCPITQHAPRPLPHPAPTEPPVTYGYEHQEPAITIRP